MEELSTVNNLIGGVTITCTQVKTDNFSSVYKAIIGCKKKIPAKLVRYFKEQMYEFVAEGNLEKRLVVANIENIEDYKDIQFFVGIGTKSGEIGEVGYKKIGLAEIYGDYFGAVGKFDADRLLRYTVPELAGNSQNLPIFKYLRNLGIDSRQSLEASPYAHCLKYLTYNENATVAAARKRFEAGNKTTHSDLIAGRGKIYRVATDLMFYPVDDAVKASILSYLQRNLAVLTRPRARGRGRQIAGMSDLRRLTCYYDRIVYGF